MSKGRILAIDYGKVRVGLAVTDPLQIIVSGLDTVENKDLWVFLESYIKEEDVVAVVLGQPRHKDGQLTNLWSDIEKLATKLHKRFPELHIDYVDEAFTSSEAKEIIRFTSKKKKRRDKKLVDKVSAVLILQKFLGH